MVTPTRLDRTRVLSGTLSQCLVVAMVTPTYVSTKQTYIRNLVSQCLVVAMVTPTYYIWVVKRADWVSVPCGCYGNSYHMPVRRHGHNVFSVLVVSMVTATR